MSRRRRIKAVIWGMTGRNVLFAPEMLPVEMRRAIVAGIRTHSLKIHHKTTAVRRLGDDEEEI